MLPPITRKYGDLSTGTYFEFVFFCDLCDGQWLSERYPFSLANNLPRNEEEKNARTILYKAEHDAAYERANTEALFHFNRCRSCGKRVCDGCFSEFEDICTSCARDKPKGRSVKDGRL